MNNDTVSVVEFCTVPGCDRPLARNRMCWSHRARMNRTGEDLRAPVPPKSSKCSVDGCRNTRRGKLCDMHYARRRREGDVGEAGRRRARDHTPRMEAAIATLYRTGWDVTPDGCWEWRGPRYPSGYGACRGMHASRTAFIAANGGIEDGLFVCHRCDNPPCVNPAHLFAGTPAENTGDAIAKGRMARGERAGSAKLTEAQVLEIRARVTAGEVQKRVAESLGVSQMTVSLIVRRKIWTHI